MDWTQVYSVDHDLLDAQHKELFAIITKLQYTLQNHGPDEGVVECLDRLVRYTEEHFAFEERMMADAGYQALDRHHTVHQTLCAELASFRRRLAKGDATVRDDLYFFLISEWLANHILGEDKAYAPAVRVRFGRGNNV